jgi:Helix-turn-helix domain
VETAAPVLLSVDQFKELLGVSHGKIWTLLKRDLSQGGLRRIRVDGRVYIPRTELEEWPKRIEEQTTQMLVAV